MPLTLAAGEQRIIPDAMAFLRAGGLAIPSGGANVAGLAPREGPLRHAARRPSSPAPGVSPGRPRAPATFGVFYPGLTLAESANGTAWVHGLQQNAAMRSNVAFVNFGDAGAVTLRVTFFGEAGQALASPEERTLAAGEWRQLGDAPRLARRVRGLGEGRADLGDVALHRLRRPERRRHLGRELPADGEVTTRLD